MSIAPAFQADRGAGRHFTAAVGAGAAPRAVGDGLAATPSYVFHMTDGGVIDEKGDVVPLAHVTAALAAPHPRRPATPTSAR